MLRWIHKFLGLSVVPLLMVLAVSGALLSILPLWDRAGTVSLPANTVNIADLAGKVADLYPGVEQIKRFPSGKIVAFYSGQDGPAASVIDPFSGEPVSDYAPSAFERWMTDLHRSLFLGDGGRVTAGVGAFMMFLLTLSGLQITARRMGGWRYFFGRSRGGGMHRLHVDLGRLAAFGLVLSTLTALYMSLVTFELIPDGTSQAPAFPEVTAVGHALPVSKVAALREIDLAQLRSLTFPNPANPADIFTLTTSTGEGFVDPATGRALGWHNYGFAQRTYEFIYMLHTGKGLWWLGLLLGLGAFGVPVLGASGGIIWWSRRRSRIRIANNISARHADTVVLVGSESGGTWGFARTLHAALTANGHKVHAAAMDNIARSYPSARRMFLLAATYGEGAAPATARKFLKNLDDIAEPPPYPVTVLGFGDTQFPQFCQFACDVEAALARKGWETLLPFTTIDRQSAQAFKRWGDELSSAMGEKLTLAHAGERPRTRMLTLVERIDYGVEVQAPSCVLRFALPKDGMAARLAGRAWPRFAAGDLMGVLPPDCTVPRYYSLASSTRDGFIEISVRKQPGGLCSGFLHGLRVGDSIAAFVKANPSFRLSEERKPVILIGAGTGMAPLAGFIRANDTRRPIHLYFGGRHPGSDFLYGHEIGNWLGDRKLTSLATAFSRIKGGCYVQDRLHRDAERLRALIADGARIMVCGGRDMAQGVMEAMAEVLAPIDLTPAILKAEGRYAEDVY